MHLYNYKLALKSGGHRLGLLLQNGPFWGEIAPLPGFSKETLEEARKEILEVIEQKKEPVLPSVRFGWQCAHEPLQEVHVPLCALGAKEGFGFAKLKLGQLGVNDAVDLVKKYKDRYRLRLDFNRKWDLNKALEFVSFFQKSDFEYLEEPVNNFNDLLQFSTLTQFPIALDESLKTSDWQKVPTLKAIVVKPTILGGIPDAPAGVALVLSSAYESGIGLLHIAKRGNKWPIGLDTIDAFEEDLLNEPICCKKGFFSWKPNKNVPLNKPHLLHQII